MPKTFSGAIIEILIFCSILIIVVLCPVQSNAQFSDPEFTETLENKVSNDKIRWKTLNVTSPLDAPLIFRLENTVMDQEAGYIYAGMAGYLGGAQAVEISSTGRAKTLKLKSDVPLQPDGEWVGYKGRFKACLLRSKTGQITVAADSLTVSWPIGVIPDLDILDGIIDSAVGINPDVPHLQTLKYVHLPLWLRAFCRLVEWVFTTIQFVTGLSWGFSLVTFVVVMKLLLLPASLLTRRFQEQANRHKAALEPTFKEIKKSYKGEVAHKKTMSAYKARGITPYYSLKPLLATMITLPFLIAIFNMLGEVYSLKASPFLWFESLAYPDKLFALSSPFPLLGSSFNLLPFIMTCVTFLSAFMLKSESASTEELRRQKRNLYLMGVVFFMLFYPFPSAMVLYWTLSTALQFGVNQFVKYKRV